MSSATIGTDSKFADFDGPTFEQQGFLPRIGLPEWFLAGPFDPHVALPAWVLPLGRRCDWHANADTPTVESSRHSTTKSLHAPDFGASEPTPRCRQGNKNGVEWRVREFEQFDEWRDRCGGDRCQAYFAEVSTE